MLHRGRGRIDRRSKDIEDDRRPAPTPIPSSRTGCTGPAAPGHLGAARTPDAEAPAGHAEKYAGPRSARGPGARWQATETGLARFPRSYVRDPSRSLYK